MCATLFWKKNRMSALHADSYASYFIGISSECALDLKQKNETVETFMIGFNIGFQGILF